MLQITWHPESAKPVQKTKRPLKRILGTPEKAFNKKTRDPLEGPLQRLGTPYCKSGP